jgi:hypothetical protein
MPSFTSADAGVPAVIGQNTAGGVGMSGVSDQGAGLSGQCLGNAPGVQGVSDTGHGVHGESRTNHAVHGESSAGRGVVGISQTFVGVTGQSTSGDGVLGTSTTGIGVNGKCAGNNPGVQGISDTGHGVHGESRTNHAVHGESAAGRGVIGISQTFVGTTGQSTSSDGVSGISTSGNGVAGESTSGSGVRGRSAAGIGVLGQGTKDAGVTGLHGNPQLQEIPTIESNLAGVFGASENGAGVMGYSRNQASFGVIAIGGIQASAVNHPLAGSFEGNVHVNGHVQITGDMFLPGADCAEQFDSAAVDGIEPGSVVVIDQQGALRQSDTAYDRKVAGVVSGAGRFRPGIVLDKQEIGADRVAVALVGKVYCKVDCQYGPIEVGDMLTSSPTAGHAMRADDPARAFGAVIGKALGACSIGRLMIPILVALQ